MLKNNKSSQSSNGGGKNKKLFKNDCTTPGSEKNWKWDDPLPPWTTPLRTYTGFVKASHTNSYLLLTKKIKDQLTMA